MLVRSKMMKVEKGSEAMTGLTGVITGTNTYIVMFTQIAVVMWYRDHLCLSSDVCQQKGVWDAGKDFTGERVPLVGDVQVNVVDGVQAIHALVVLLHREGKFESGQLNDVNVRAAETVPAFCRNCLHKLVKHTLVSYAFKSLQHLTST